jgi:hypothetical protein
VNESATETPIEDKDSPINSAHALSLEATNINQQFIQQVLTKVDFCFHVNYNWD